MPGCGARLCGAMFAVLLLGGASGCSASVSVGTTDYSTKTPQQQAAVSAGYVQRPETCKIAPPRVHFPTGEWTATDTVTSTNAIDVCVGEKQVGPWDFRRTCDGGQCKTYLYAATYYGVAVAQVVPKGRGRYVATFRPTQVPCPHPPGEGRGTNQGHRTMTLRWSPDKLTLNGLSREYQVGPCGGGPAETASYVAVRTNPGANPPAEGP
jgi:hypothetical protein